MTRRGTIPRIVTDEHCVSDLVNAYFNTRNHARIRVYEIRA